MGRFDRNIEREVARRFREYMRPHMQASGDAEVLRRVEDNSPMFMLSVRLNATLREVFRPLGVPLRRWLRRLV